MIFSRWRPDKGGYDYFESAERVGMGDDLPTPLLPGGTAIGVPSTEAGRQPRGPVRPVGSGPVARGSIMPLSRAGLAGVGALGVSLETVFLAAVALVAGFWIGRRRR